MTVPDIHTENAQEICQFFTRSGVERWLKEQEVSV